jgi:hypothetical protein
VQGRLLAAAVVFVLTAIPALAADAAGKWVAHVPAVQGQAESDITFVFKVDGGNLTGTLNNSAQPGDVEIKEGKVNGDELSFSLTRNIGGADMKVLWKGTMAGDEIKFTRSLQGGAGPGGGGATEMTAKRAKP